MNSVQQNTENAGNRRGSLLIMVLGILAVLSLLGSALMAISKQEEKSAREFVEQSRAQFAAESGIEAATAKLLDYRNSLYDVPEFVKAEPAIPGLPMRYLLRSSFGSIDTDGDGNDDAAGYISETYSPKGDFYRLRVESAQNRINLNDSNSPLNIDTDPWEDQIKPERDYLDIPQHLRSPTVSDNPALDCDPDWIYPGQSDYDASRAALPNRPYPRTEGRLANIISELVGIIFPASADVPADLGKQVAKALFDARRRNVGDQFAQLSQIKEALVPKVLDETKYNRFISYCTLASWRDENVLRPTFQWRINTPPIIKVDWPDLPATQHNTDYPGGLAPGFPGLQALNHQLSGPPRPGYEHPNLRGADMLDPISYDFNYDDVITEDSLGYTEVSRHDRDIYLYSDMQTRYFAAEARSPIDINHAPLELLQALLTPIQGWYLQEAPSLWNGEDRKSRAEDWSQAEKGMLWTGYNHPFRSVVRYCIMGGGLVGPLEGGYMYSENPFPDECQYYYYDEITRTFEFIKTMHEASLYDMREGYGRKNNRFGELQQTKSLKEPLQTDDQTTIAEKLAEAIHEKIHGTTYNPFQTWESFEEFIQDLADIGNGDTVHLTGDQKDFDPYMASAVIANFNPNSRINDYNPNKRIYLHVDKSQLSGFSAEFCFHPMGQFDIESLGRVSKGDILLAQSSFRCNARTQEFFRVSSQSQFMSGYEVLGGTPLSAFSSPSTGIVPTSGSAAGYAGHSIQSYPEPEYELGNWIRESFYDGYLMLATYQPEREEFFAVGNQSQFANNVFVADMNKTLNATHALGGDGGFISDQSPESWVVDHWRFNKFICSMTGPDGYPPGFGGWDWDWWLPDLTSQIPANNPAPRSLCKPLSKLVSGLSVQDAPGNLFPDGALSDAGRTLQYKIANNLGSPDIEPDGNKVEGRRGSVQFWLKPNFDVAHANRLRKWFTAPPRLGDYTWGYPETWPYSPGAGGASSDPTCDFFRDFSLYYFSRGGHRIPVDAVSDEPSDSAFSTYMNNHDINGGEWLPTRSLFLSCGNQGCTMRDSTGFPVNYISHWNYGLGSTTVNQSWRKAEEFGTGAETVWRHPFMNVETRAWSHIAFSWDWLGIYKGAGNGLNGKKYDAPARFARMTVNGQSVEEDRDEFPLAEPYGSTWNPQHYEYIFEQRGDFQTKYYAMRDALYYDGLGNENYMRFGESSSAWWGNHVADATFDEISSSKLTHDDLNLMVEYQYGRYYAENNATYISPELNIFAQQRTGAEKLLLHSVAWTAYWPLVADDSKAPNHARFNDNLQSSNSGFYLPVRGIEASSFKYNPKNKPDPMSARWGEAWAPFSIDILNCATNQWYYESVGISNVNMPNYAGGSIDPDWQTAPLKFEKNKNHKLRFKVHFNLEDGQTLYTSPVFDDITFCFSMNRPTFHIWEIAD